MSVSVSVSSVFLFRLFSFFISFFISTIYIFYSIYICYLLFVIGHLEERDIPRTVQKVRLQRSGMVQTEVHSFPLFSTHTRVHTHEHEH